MSESWKNRFWSLLLVCTFAVVLSVCNKAINNSSGGSSSSGTAFADGSSVTISSMPNLTVASTATVSSIPSVTIASQPMPTISGIMICLDSYNVSNESTRVYYNCDASDDTVLDTINYQPNAITHDGAFTSGWRMVGPGCSFSTGASNVAKDSCYMFYK